MKIDDKSKFILLNTVFVGDNYGSSLQAYALKQYLEDLTGASCYIVSRREKGFDAIAYSLKIKALNCIKSFLSIDLFLRTWASQVNKIRNVDNVDVYPTSIREKFTHFTEEYIEPVYLTQKELEKYARCDNCICCVTGSDQVWNPTSNYLQPNNFLMFSPKEKNISYAASIGVTKIPAFNYMSFRHKVQNIKYISVRETQAKQLLSTEFRLESQVCVDPVVLVGKDFWLKKKEPANTASSYTFCYFLNLPSKQAIQTIKEKMEEGEKVLILSRMKDVQLIGAAMIDDVSPLQFVTYIQNSNTVLTDSFHGMMFSILLNKNFFIFERDYMNHVPQPSRIISILTQLGLSERYIRRNTKNIPNTNIDYSCVNGIVEEKREIAMTFLKEAVFRE